MELWLADPAKARQAVHFAGLLPHSFCLLFANVGQKEELKNRGKLIRLTQRAIKCSSYTYERLNEGMNNRSY